MNRALSKPLTALLLKTPLTPNQVTLMSLCFGIFSSVFLAQGTYTHFIFGVLCFQIAMILDNCDGNIARAKNLQSEFGGWLDIFVDILVDILFFGGLALGLQRADSTLPVALLGSLCIAGCILNGIIVSAEKIRGFGPAVFKTPHPEGTNRGNVFFKVVNAVREGDSSWFVLFFAIAGKMELLLLASVFYIQILWLSDLLMNHKWLFAKPTGR